jgi:hypothetical protein
MIIRTHYFAAAAAIAALAVPAAAQTPYPYAYQQAPQSYPSEPNYGYAPQGYNQGYAQDPVSQVVNSLLGNRYNVTERQAVSQCASAAMTQATAQYGSRYNQGYGNNGYNRGYDGAMRVTSITDVQRRYNGLRVSGLMSSGYSGEYGQNGNRYGDNQYGNENRGYARGYSAGEVSFRCNVDYRGQVTNVRIGRNNAYRG